MSNKEDDPGIPNQQTKKRTVTGRVHGASKLMRLSHLTGPDCNCKRYKCFQETTKEEREALIKEFNLLTMYDNQN